MTPVEAVQAELEQITQLLAQAQTEPLEAWSAGWMNAQTLMRRQQDLFNELRLLEGRYEYEIELIGGAERGHEIDSDFLGLVLRSLQGAIGGAVYGVMRGEGARGRLPRSVLDASNLRVAAATAGSFVLRLDGPPRAAVFTTDGERELPPFDEAMTRVLDVIEAAEQEERHPDQLLGAITAVGSNRAVQHLAELTRALARTATSATVVEHSPFADEPREVRLPIMTSAHLADLLTRTQQTTETVYRIGKLTGIRWSRAVFDLEIEHAPAQQGMVPIVEVISGHVIPDIREEVREAFDSTVRAELQRTVSRLDAGAQERVLWRLMSIEPIQRDAEA